MSSRQTGISETPTAFFWKQNLELLRTRYPELAKLVESNTDDKDSLFRKTSLWRLEQTPTGNPTVVFQENPDSQGVSIHSRRDPVREGQRQAEAALTDAEKTESATGKTKESAACVIILLGFGLGYTAEALIKDGHILIIVERRTELFQIALEQRNLEKLLSPGKAIFVLEDSSAINAALTLLEKSLAGGSVQKPLVIKNRALCTLTAEDESWYAEAARRINTWTSKDEINAATLQRFGKRWTRNLAANMKGTLHFPGVKNLENILVKTDIPVFLAAAGPSLNRVEPFLEEIRQRCVIVAVDTALRFLLWRGVEPDFVVSVDPQYWNALHLYRLNAPRTTLIAESAVYPPVLRNSVFYQIFFCQSLFPLGRFIEDRADPKGPLGAGGSVATTAWDFARLLGPAAIWIAGIDLAFPGYQTHFKGALFEENAHAASWRLCPAETFSVQALENGFPFRALSANGGKVLSDRRLSLYAAWFENRLEQIDQTGLANFSLSPGGLAVPGFVNAEPEELLALPLRREELDRILKNVYCRVDSELNKDMENRTKRYAKALTDLLGGLEEIRDSAAEAASAASRGLASGGNQLNKTETILKKLDRANTVIAKSPVKDAAGFLFPPIAELEKELRQTEPLKRHLEFSLLFYQSLVESVDFTLGYIRR